MWNQGLRSQRFFLPLSFFLFPWSTNTTDNVCRKITAASSKSNPDVSVYHLQNFLMVLHHECFLTHMNLNYDDAFWSQIHLEPSCEISFILNSVLFSSWLFLHPPHSTILRYKFSSKIVLFKNVFDFFKCQICQC